MDQLQELFNAAGPASKSNFKSKKGKYASRAKKKKKSGAGSANASKKPNKKPSKTPAEIVTPLYLTILSRFPTPEELNSISEYMESSSSSRNAVEDIAWALINTEEFLFRH